jgi:hypothetical protein
VSDTLVVEINRDGSGGVEAPASFEADGSFDVRLRNRGEGTHVYVNLDDALAAVADVAATNYYLDAGETLDVPVDVTADVSEEPAEGTIRIVTRYGATERQIAVTLDGTGSGDVRVDPDLARPQPEPEPSPLADLWPALLIGAAGIVVVAVALYRGLLIVGSVGVVLLLVAGAYAAISR